MKKIISIVNWPKYLKKMNKTIIKVRNSEFDFIAGIFIIQIIVMHILQVLNYYEKSFFYNYVMHISFFFMPWFYFKSGFFSSNRHYNFRDFISIVIKKNLIPFIFFFWIGFIINVPFEIYNSKRPLWRIFSTPFYEVLVNGGGGYWNAPIWFLLSLFIVNIFYYIIDNKFDVSIILLFPLLGFLIFISGIKMYLGLNNVFIATFFYAYGRFSKKSILVKPSFVDIIFILTYIIIQIICFSNVDFRTHSVTEGNYFSYLISAMIGIYILNKYLLYMGIRTNKLTLIFSDIGRNSIIYFACHWIFLMLIKNITIICMFKMNKIYMILLYLLFSLFGSYLFGFLFKNKYKFLIGK